MGNDYFEDILKRMYQNTCDSYNQLGSSSNQTIGDIIKSLAEELDQKRKGKHEPKFTDEEFNKTCEELGLVEDK